MENEISEASYLYKICNSKDIKICANQQVDLHRISFTENSLKILLTFLICGSCFMIGHLIISETKGLFIWRWAGPVKQAGSPRWDDFYPTFTWNLLSQFNQKVCYITGKRLFDQVFFTIRWRKAIMQNKCSYII